MPLFVADKCVDSWCVRHTCISIWCRVWYYWHRNINFRSASLIMLSVVVAGIHNNKHVVDIWNGTEPDTLTVITSHSIIDVSRHDAPDQAINYTRDHIYLHCVICKVIKITFRDETWDASFIEHSWFFYQKILLRYIPDGSIGNDDDGDHDGDDDDMTMATTMATTMTTTMMMVMMTMMTMIIIIIIIMIMIMIKIMIITITMIIMITMVTMLATWQWQRRRRWWWWWCWRWWWNSKWYGLKG